MASEIVLGLSPSLSAALGSGARRELLTGQLETMKQELYSELDWSGETPSISIETHAIYGFGFVLSLEGRRCRGPVETSLRPPSFDAVIEQVSACLFNNRDLFVPFEAMARAVMTSLTPPIEEYLRFAALAGHSMDACAEKLRLLQSDQFVFDHGLAPDDANGAEEQAQIEILRSTLSSPTIEFELNPSSVSGSEESSLAQSLKERVGAESGVAFPKMTCVTDPGMPPDKFRISIGRRTSRRQKLSRESVESSLTEQFWRHAHLFVTTLQVDRMLSMLRQAFPMAVFNAVEVYGSIFITRLLRNLLAEGVGVRDLRTILGALLEVNGEIPAELEGLSVHLPAEAGYVVRTTGGSDTPTCEEYTDYVRSQLRHQICYSLALPEGEIVKHPLSERVERVLSNNGRSLDFEREDRLVRAIYEAVDTDARHHVVVASSTTRRRLRELIARDFPNLAVLARDELSAHVRVDSREAIDVGFE